MNGKRAKQLRKATGVSVAFKRNLRIFERAVETAREARAARSVSSMRSRRAAFAITALGVVLAAILSGLFL